MRNVPKYLTLFVLFCVFCGIIYFGSRPVTYQVSVGDTSPYDIEAPRTAIDEAKTEQRATEARANVLPIWMRSESYSNNLLARVNNVLTTIETERAELYGLPQARTVVEALEETEEEGPTLATPTRTPSDAELQLAVSSLISNIDQNYTLTFQASDIETMLSMDVSRYANFQQMVMAHSQSLMNRALDNLTLTAAINQIEVDLDEELEFYTEDAGLVARSLTVLLRANVVSNREATENARQAAYDRVKSNPIMINRGTRIVSQGEVIDEETMQLLEALDLTPDSRFDWKGAGGIVLMMAILFLLSILYFSIYQPEFVSSTRNIFALGVALIIPLVVSMLIGKAAPLATPIYFAAVVICAYFGFRTAFFMTALLSIAMMPMLMFEPAFAIVAIAGSATAILYTKGMGRHDNFAKIILMTAGTTLLMTLSYGLMANQSWTQLATAAIGATISAILSVISAIGIMPLFELIFNTVSPLRLIELSQPGHALLKRLFVEAPGTSQHSMMVANLADSAAEAIGANAMIARVGAYYHDIGKLENPMMFAENQLGANPHDELTPEESLEIIRRHPEDGVKLARRYRLPQPVLRIIEEHHGTTVVSYFYHKAKELAEQKGETPPAEDDYCYRTPLPSSRESAIVMLADSTEATMKALQAEDLQEAEKVIRNVIRTKVEQDQLKNSHLSFRDVETITMSFLQVYAGHFHERIQYPDTSDDER